MTKIPCKRQGTRKQNDMKSTINILTILSITFLMSCQKEYPTGAEYDPYSFATLDEKGGTWTPILLNAPTQISVPAPVAITSPEYLTELDAVKKSMANVIDEDRKLITYWGNNPIVRWNEIARELAAKYNLTPAPNADGTYPAPSAANPGVYPYFPFAHPPYASRAFAYLSAAQFDGLIAAWHYKYQFNRPAPSKNDASIEPVLPDQNLPSYPSDGAVIATVSVEILSALFPLEKEFLKTKAAEMRLMLSLSGMNVESDIVAGEELGKGIAAVYLKRASTDGMSKAQSSKAVSDSLANEAFKRFGWKWQNMESPQRPVGIAPLFGKVKPWHLVSVEAVRPPAPPELNSAAFQNAAKELQETANNLTNEQRKIANWWSDGLGTYTPPGHWNRFATDFIIKYKLNPIRTARVYAYLNTAVQDAGISCWDAKYYYNYPRPIQAIPGFKTILGTPNFPAYTSGHSTFSAAAASVLSYLFPQEKALVEKHAKEAADSRIYGGIHYRFDSEAGLEQGRKVAEFTVQKASKDGAD